MTLFFDFFSYCRILCSIINTRANTQKAADLSRSTCVPIHTLWGHDPLFKEGISLIPQGIVRMVSKETCKGERLLVLLLQVSLLVFLPNFGKSRPRVLPRLGQWLSYDSRLRLQSRGLG
jgi:hypothetical protein